MRCEVKTLQGIFSYVVAVFSMEIHCSSSTNGFNAGTLLVV